MEWIKEFDDMCVVNRDGDCKYFNFGDYDGQPKFFAQKIKDFITTQITNAREEVFTDLEAMRDELQEDIFDTWRYEEYKKATLKTNI